ncbi:MAG: hypothetical protein J0M24_16715 [Verrucomicrobia bacterium]|nr:hypothetical protein [Verrucomicrobiota bacterium]
MKRISLRFLAWGLSLLVVGAVRSADTTLDVGNPAADVPEIKLPAGTTIPADVKGLVETFQAQAQEYIKQQRELAKQAKGASKDEKQRLLDQIKSNRKNFLDQTKEIRNDIKERIKELKRDISESRPQAAGAGESGGRRRHGRD